MAPDRVHSLTVPLVSVRAAVLASLVLVAALAGGVGVDPAAGAATAASSASATDVVAGQNAADGVVEFDVTVENASTATLTVDTSALRSAGASVSTVTAQRTGGPADFAVTGSGTAGGDATVSVEDTGSVAGAATGSVSVRITYDTTGAGTQSGLSLPVTNGTGTQLAAPNTALVDPVVSAGTPTDIRAASGQSQRIGGVTVALGGSDDGFVYLDVTPLVDAGASVSSAGPVTASGADSAGSGTVVTRGSDTVFYASVTDGNDDGRVTLDANLSGVDASGVTVGTSPSYSVAGSTGSSADSRYDGRSGVPSGPPTTSSFSVRRPSDVTRAGPGGSGPFDTSAGRGVVYEGAVVYQGEDDIEFGGRLSSSLTGVSGNAAGQVLGPPISSSQQLGRYSNDGTSAAPAVTVNRPRITELEVENANGADISGGSVAQSAAGDLAVVASYNYHEAEDLRVEVINENDLEVSGEVLTTRQKNGPGSLEFPLDLSGQSAGEYTVRVEGSDALSRDGDGPESAIEETTVDVTTSDDIDLRTDSITQGSDLRYEVRGGAAGDFHLVRIGSGDFRDGVSNADAARIFNNVGTVRERGYVTDGGSYVQAGSTSSSDDVRYAYAIVEIDDDNSRGVGTIDTTSLDTTSVEIEVSNPLATSGGTWTTPPTPRGDGNLDADETDVEVEEGSVRLRSPGDEYVVGASVTVRGSASSGMDSVAIYARDDGDYELVLIDGDRTISVDADGEFEEDEIQLSGSGPGNRILTLPGTYRIGVIDAAGADPDGDGTVEDSLSTQEFTSGASDQRSIRVVEPSLAGEFPSVVDGEIADADGDVDASGDAVGADEVLFVAVGDRGEVVTDTVQVEDDGSFEETDISLAALSRGEVELFLYATGRDGRVGDGSLPSGFSATLDGFAEYLDREAGGSTDSLDAGGLTGRQIRSALRAESVDATASDDLLVSQTVQLTDARLQITDVYQRNSAETGINPVEVDNTMIVEGTTNLQPEDNVIAVELRNAEISVDLTTTELWGGSGNWVVRLDTDDAAPGTYQVEADDGQSAVRVDVELVTTLATPTPTPTEAPTPTATETPTATPSSTATLTPLPPLTPTPEPTSGSLPGFGALPAVLAVLAVVLLAARRADR